MGDGWGARYECTRVAAADLGGWRRVFNKASGPDMSGIATCRIASKGRPAAMGQDGRNFAC